MGRKTNRRDARMPLRDVTSQVDAATNALPDDDCASRVSSEIIRASQTLDVSTAGLYHLRKAHDAPSPTRLASERRSVLTGLTDVRHVVQTTHNEVRAAAPAANKPVETQIYGRIASLQRMADDLQREQDSSHERGLSFALSSRHAINNICDEVDALKRDLAELRVTAITAFVRGDVPPPEAAQGAPPLSPRVLNDMQSIQQHFSDLSKTIKRAPTMPNLPHPYADHRSHPPPSRPDSKSFTLALPPVPVVEDDIRDVAEPRRRKTLDLGEVDQPGKGKPLATAGTPLNSTGSVRPGRGAARGGGRSGPKARVGSLQSAPRDPANKHHIYMRTGNRLWNAWMLYIVEVCCDDVMGPWLALKRDTSMLFKERATTIALDGAERTTVTHTRVRGMRCPSFALYCKDRTYYFAASSTATINAWCSQIDSAVSKRRATT